VVICDEENVNAEGRYVGIPALVVEVLSPSTRGKDMAAKLNLYMKSGVREYWVVDLERKVIFQYTFSEERDIDYLNTFGLEDTVKSAAFAGLGIKISDIMP
jgi:Uma2 family endonuclease